MYATKREAWVRNLRHRTNLNFHTPISTVIGDLFSCFRVLLSHRGFNSYSRQAGVLRIIVSCVQR